MYHDRPLNALVLEVPSGSEANGLLRRRLEREVYMLFVGPGRLGGAVGARSGGGS